MGHKVIFLAEGDAETRDCWSGSAMHFVHALRDKGVEVVTLNAELTGMDRGLAALASFAPNKARWRQRYTLGPAAAALKGSKAARLVRQVGPVTAVIQVGATFTLPEQVRRQQPYILYCDGNIGFAEAGIPFSGVTNLAPAQRTMIRERERRIYGGVDRIWAFSDALAASFEKAFGVPRAKLTTIAAGANNAPPPVVRSESPAPRLLFVGKDHRRKGSEMLLAAFALVHARMPEATLDIVGASDPVLEAPGVTVHGFLRMSVPDEKARLLELYRTASAFVLPSRYEPFGVVFLEAMQAGLPCIGIRKWAMPEMIAEGETGLLVEDGNAEDLARAMETLLRDPALAVRMGRAGQARVAGYFTWAHTADRAVADLDRLVSPGAA